MTNVEAIRIDLRLHGLRTLARGLASRVTNPAHVDELEVAVDILDRADTVADDEAEGLLAAAGLRLLQLADAVGYDELDVPLEAASN